MNAAVWVEVEHLITGRCFLAQYIEDREELWIDGALVPLRLFWAVAHLGPVDGKPQAAGTPWQDLYGYDPADAELLEDPRLCTQQGRTA